MGIDNHFYIVTLIMMVTSGVMMLAAVQAGLLSFFSKTHRLLYTSFSIVCLVVAGYQLASSFLLNASDVNQMQKGLQWQTGMSILALPSVFIFIAVYTRQAKPWLWFVGLSLFAFVLLIINSLAPLGLQYGDTITLYALASPDQQQYVYPQGSSFLAGLMLQLSKLGLIVWVMVRLVRLCLETRSLSAMLLVGYSVVQLLTFGYRHIFDPSDVSLLYLSGFSAVLLSLVMSIILYLDYLDRSRLLERRNQMLEAEVSKRRLAELTNYKWKQVVSQASLAMAVFDRAGKCLTSNAAYDQYWANCLENFQGQTPLFNVLNLASETFKDANGASVEKATLLALKKGHTYSGWVVLKNAWLRCNTYPVYDQNDEFKEIVISHRDVTQEEIINLAMSKIAKIGLFTNSQPFFNSLVSSFAEVFQTQSAFIGVLDTDVQGELTIKTLSHYSDGEIVDNFRYQLKHSPCEQVYGAKVCSYPSGVQELFPYDELLQEMGIEGYLGAPIFDPSGGPVGILAAIDTRPLHLIDNSFHILDIFTARAGAELARMKAEEQMRHMAFEDYLTQLPNRARMHEELQSLLAKCESSHSQAAMYLLDLDNFKTINDGLGHDIGDEVIRKVGKRLRDELPASCFIARMGGDEFIVLDCDCSLGHPDVERFANKILGLIMRPVQIGERILSVGASIGIVVFPSELPTEKPSNLDLLRYADIALYKAKSTGKNNFVIFESSLQSDLNERLDIERGLRIALKEHQLQLYLQPQIDNEGAVIGAEALLRWLHPEEGMIPPDRFIPVAEESGLILKLGDWVLETALDLLQQWSKAGNCFPGRLSVNISAWQFAQQNFVNHLQYLTTEHNISPELLTLELTETALLSDISEAKQKLLELQKLGFKISLDDFGTGYSSLAYLRVLPLDGFKIDKAFVDEVRSGQDQPLVESMLAIGRHLNLDVVAEGVETEAQRIQLEKMGCRLFQGYFFARPMPMSEFSDWYETREVLCD